MRRDEELMEGTTSSLSSNDPSYPYMFTVRMHLTDAKRGKGGGEKSVMNPFSSVWSFTTAAALSLGCQRSNAPG